MAVESFRFRKETAKRPLDHEALLACKQEIIEAAEVPKRIKLEAAHEPAQANFSEQLSQIPQTNSKSSNPTQNAVIQLKKRPPVPPLPPNIAVKLEQEEVPAQATNNNSGFKAPEECQPAVEKPLNVTLAVPVIKKEVFDDRLDTPSPVNSNTSSSTAISEEQRSLQSSASDLQTTKQASTKSSSNSAISLPKPSKLQLVCTSCPAKVGTWFELLRHHSTFHKAKPDLVLHECDLCHKKFHYRKSLICHQKTHTSTWVACPLCDRKFKNDIDKNRHYKEIHGDPPKFKCQICGDRFRTPGSIIDHVQFEHRTPKARPSTSTRRTRFQGRRTSSAQQLRSQGRQDFDLIWTCTVCGQEFASESLLTTHYRKRRVDPMTCEICAKVFCYETGFLKHIKEHQQQNGRDLSQRVCSKCRMEACTCGSDSFFNNDQAQVSRGPVSGMEPQEHPSPRRPRRGFSAKKTINVMKEQRFNCKDCGGTFKTKRILEVHRRVHTGEKPFACGSCDKKYTNAGALWTHKKNNHKNV